MPDLIEKPLGCTCFKLRKLTRAMSRLYDQHMATVGLKTTQYSVLTNAAREALPVAELAERLGTERTTLTRNLKPLIEAQLDHARSGRRQPPAHRHHHRRRPRQGQAGVRRLARRPERNSNSCSAPAPCARCTAA